VSGTTEAPEPAWREAVTIREDVDLERVLVSRLPPAGGSRAVAVTDLVSPRSAFWRAISPVAPDPGRVERLELGRSVHRQLGSALAPEGALEVRVRREGFVGRIDLWADLPVEVKSVTRPVHPLEWASARPDQVEQLAMYAALTERRVGRLVSVEPTLDSAPQVEALEVVFDKISDVAVTMRQRAEALRRAWRDRSSSGLPACRWFGRGCEYQQAEVCDCAAGEAPGEMVAPGDVTVRPVPELAARIEARLRASPPATHAPTLRRFHDLLYLRRAYFERTTPTAESEPPRWDPTAPQDLYDRLRAAVESGPLGEVTRLAPRTEEPEEEVGGFRGQPFLLRASRARDRSTPDTLLDRQPQYALELGLRCVATGSDTARLVLGREREPTDGTRVQVFEFRFAPATHFARLWRVRAQRLASAIAEHAPERLPPCPEWMYSDCPYREACACGPESGRSQR
jgi:hypothetical protein